MKIEFSPDDPADVLLLRDLLPTLIRHHELRAADAPRDDDSLGRGHDALARLVAFWRSIRDTPDGMEKDDIGPALLAELATHGDALAVYVKACGGRLWRACLAVWSLDYRGTSQEQAATDEADARKCAGALVTIASAHGHQLPLSWLGEEVSDG